VDSSGKKTAFVTQAAAELGLRNVTVITGRIEQMQTHRHDVIVSRAFSSLYDFAGKTRAHLAAGGTWAAMKGVVPRDEIDALPDDVRCTAIIPLVVPGLDAERHLILMKSSS
jgi:16S rRNA (guanine527-N7)-methyltransferase